MKDAELKEVPDGLGELMLEWRRHATNKLWAGSNDCSWWYGERASVSQLAGAAWTLGGWAMQDWAWKRGAKNAWIDLCVEHVGRDLRFIAEAKQIWPEMNGEGVIRDLDAALRAARGQLDGISRDDWDQVSFVFIVPWVRDLQGVDDAIARFVEVLRRVDGVGLVWTFPEWALKHEPHQGLYYPGVALVARRERIGRGRKVPR